MTDKVISAHVVFICDECGNYNVFDSELERDPVDGYGMCQLCGTDKWSMYSKNDYSNSEHWRMVCLAKHVLKQGGNNQMRMFLNKFEKRNGPAITIKLKEFCRVEYDRASNRS